LKVFSYEISTSYRYPLFILVEKLVSSLLVFGSVAWRMNVGMALVLYRGCVIDRGM
jgi:hypothetical protein